MMRQDGLRCDGKSQNIRIPRSDRATGRVLCIDTLPIHISEYLFDKGVCVDTLAEGNGIILYPIM